MNILITGSSGFLGTNIINSPETTKFKFYKYDRAKPLYPNNINAVIHCAGIAHNSHDKLLYKKYYEGNFKLTKRIFDDFLESNSSVFIFLSTSTIYNEIKNKRIAIKETEIGTNLSIYAETKLLAENYISSKKHTKKVYILRPSLIVGDNPKGNLLLLKKLINFKLPIILPSKLAKKSLTDVRNIIFVINKFLKFKNNIPSGVYNICDSNYNDLKVILEKISVLNNANARLYNLPNVIFIFLLNFLSFFNLKLSQKFFNLFFTDIFIDKSKLEKAIDQKLPFNSFE